VPVVGVAETMLPQGFGDPVHAVPLRLHVTAVLLVLLTVAVNVTVWVTYAATMGAFTFTVIAGPGPLPPVAHPLAKARLNRAAANSNFLIIVRSLGIRGYKSRCPNRLAIRDRRRFPVTHKANFVF
jgi:hypothetical protein